MKRLNMETKRVGCPCRGSGVVKTRKVSPSHVCPGAELLVRNSEESLHKILLFSLTNAENPNKSNKWSIWTLRRDFRNKELEPLYERYIERIRHSLYMAFFFWYIAANLINITFLAAFSSQKGVTEGGTEYDVLFLYIPYCVSIVLMVIIFLLVKDEKRFHRSPCLQWVSVTITLVILMGAEITTMSIADEEPPAGNMFSVIVAIYVLIPVLPLLSVVLAGLLFFTVITVLSVLIFYKIDYNEPSCIYKRVISDILFCLLGNATGFFIVFNNEISCRRAFLDKRKSVKQTKKLEYEKQREDELIRCLMPNHFISQVSDAMNTAVANMVKHRIPANVARRRPFSDLYVESHPQVSILFADIVNFTPLTEKMEVHDLVLLLNEIFAKFDDAAEKNQCLRIKILGDCYYCVSGCPEPSEHHARNCVIMGFNMIEILRHVRESHDLDIVKEIDMRIGVHTGMVISGLIGIKKWQYDIWSKDVQIAALMEHSGVKGYVHITEATQQHLCCNDFEILPGFGSDRDPDVAKMGLTTYLVKPPRNPLHVKNQSYLPALLYPSLNQSNDTGDYTTHILRKPVIRKCSSRKHTTNQLKELERALSQTVLSKRRHHVDLTLSVPVTPRTATPPVPGTPVYNTVQGLDDEVFEEIIPTYYSHNETAEKDREKRPPRLNKKSVLRRTTVNKASVEIFQTLNTEINHLMREAIEAMPFDMRSIWLKARDISPVTLGFKNSKYTCPYLTQFDPMFKISLLGVFIVYLFMLAIFFITMFMSKWVVGLFIILMAGIALLLLLVPMTWFSTLWHFKEDPHQDTLHCSQEPHMSLSKAKYPLNKRYTARRPTGRTLLFYKISKAFASDIRLRTATYLFVSALMTVTSVSAIHYLWYLNAMAIVSANIMIYFHFLFKLAVSLVMLVIQVIVLFWSTDEEHFDSHKDELINPRTVLVRNAIILVLTLHIIDRQLEYIRRLEFTWKKRLVKEKKKEVRRSTVNHILLENILTKHIAKWYLSLPSEEQNKSDVYTERPKKIAVMFASIENFSEAMESMGLENDIKAIKYLNEIISEFDTLLFEPEFWGVEKIKIVVSTYMAACGVTSDEAFDKLSEDQKVQAEENYLVVMVRFAGSMMKRLQPINKDQFQGHRLRIGINWGVVVAGIVGAKKPFYDIWGDTVNVASRMDSSGKPNCIQVTKQCADILKKVGFEVTYRGTFDIKGKGLTDTYFVDPFSGPRGVEPDPTPCCINPLLLQAYPYSETSTQDFHDIENVETMLPRETTTEDDLSPQTSLHSYPGDVRIRGPYVISDDTLRSSHDTGLGESISSNSQFDNS